MSEGEWRPATPPEHLVLDDRIVLRRWQTHHADPLATAVGSSVDHLRPWMPWATADYDREDAEQFLEHTERSWDAGDEFTYGIWDDEEVVGSAGLHARIGAGRLEIGYWLRADRTGQGIARRAAAALVEAAFGIDDVQAVEIHHAPDNIRSGLIPEALGFTHVGVVTVRSDEADDDRTATSVWELRREAWRP